MIAIEYMESSDKKEILESIQGLEIRMNDRFDKIDMRFEKVDERFDKIDGRFEATESELMEAIHDLSDQLEGLTGRVTRIESQMVTKDYLDRKIDDLRGDLVALSKKTNTKFNVLIEQLVINGTLKRKVADQILALEPFPIVQMA